MRSRIQRSHGITHSLTPFLQETQQPLAEYEIPDKNAKKYSPLYQKESYYNPHKQRSRKHRLIEQKNTDIQRQNRRLYEKLRKIKMKNAFQSEEKLPSIDNALDDANFGNTMKPLSLPQVSHHFSMNSTKSELNTILSDRKTFVNKYFEELGKIRGKGAKKTEELGNFICNGWKIKVLLLDDEYIVLRGRKGIKELNKKYMWERVKNKMTSGLEEWVKFKFEFED